ncbi:MAG: site-2 protease family protein [Candidatus Natronoplasma sp.]
MLSSGMIIALVLIFGFIAAILVLDRFEMLEPYGLDVSGPFLMWKTKGGKNFIERLSKKERFWKYYGNFGLIIVSISMVIIFLLVAWSAYVATSIPAEEAPETIEILALPGLNPLIPLWFGILGLAVAIIVHEFSHGILARIADIDINSLGLIFLVVPIGAFVEPDEDQMEELESIKRGRIYAAGPTTNIVLAIVIVLIFSTLFMGAVSAREEGVVVSSIVNGSPAAETELKKGEQILSVGGERVKNTQDFTSVNITPMQEVNVETLRGDEYRNHTMISGLIVAGVIEGRPAEKAEMEKGDIITGIDDRTVKNYDDFSEALEDKEPHQEIEVTFNRKTDDDYEEDDLILELDERDGEAYMGVMIAYLGVTTWNVEMIPRLLSSPFADAEGVQGHIQSTLQYMALPFLGLSPLPDEIAELYTVSGPLSVLPRGAFWTIANSLYWVFWLNLLVGLFNALPAVPLDGGFIFKDGMNGLVKKLGLDGKKGEKISSGIAYVLALTVLFLLLWQLVGPRI